jgi:hypothetical protein
MSFIRFYHIGRNALRAYLYVQKAWTIIRNALRAYLYVQKAWTIIRKSGGRI